MVNALKRNCSQLLAGIYGKSRQRSTQRCHYVNEGHSFLEAERVRALGALRSLRFEKKLVAQNLREMQSLSNKEKQKWIEDYAETETTRPRKQVDDGEAVIRQDHEDTEAAEHTALINKEPKKTFHEIFVAIEDSLSDIPSSNNGEDTDDEDHGVIEQGQLSEDDKPSWVMGTITKIVQQRMERFRQKQMKLDKLTQTGW